MRILHLCLSNFYVDGFSYQENELVRQNVEDGHEVRVIASTEQIATDGTLFYSRPSAYLGRDGAMVERVAYARFLPHAVMRKLRIHGSIYRRIEAFRPDVILFHSACGYEILTAAKYVRDHPEVTLFVDSHEDFMNSARGLVSKWALHYAYYRPILLHALPQIAKVLPVNLSALEFMRDFYGVPADKLEFYPLGGTVPGDEDYAALRRAKREELAVPPDAIMLVQSGKLDRSKKLIEALEAFTRTSDQRLRFVIAGRVHTQIAEQVDALIARDNRITAVGWQSGDELRALMCAADVYCQPGTQSSTMQMAICCRCAILLDDVPSHGPYLAGNGWLVGDRKDLERRMAELASCSRADLDRMASASLELALRMLDYRLLAARLYRQQQT
ncbi:MAG: glycosyltransferase family 4 protein [Qipengyuania sp.]|nr:glycosyltransferase family 4 protein [Qipengyuania sp.]